MGRGKPLTDIEKRQIVAYSESGLSTGAIAKRLERSWNKRMGRKKLRSAPQTFSSCRASSAARGFEARGVRPFPQRFAPSKHISA
ncbi:hypothetical protein PHMEG_0006380 [Phytophthora megakarya]|uniref:Transposase IS30-like HTH domain-containing protein n=1 Tax=Phytophthora megakarya TaxID=4795 RepID=A0A225WP47_9STRA|nr:hypothetical protein PHMEG_0006380 [Phytophthora megakarya]